MSGRSIIPLVLRAKPEESTRLLFTGCRQKLLDFVRRLLRRPGNSELVLAGNQARSGITIERQNFRKTPASLVLRLIEAFPRGKQVERRGRVAGLPGCIAQVVPGQPAQLAAGQLRHAALIRGVDLFWSPDLGVTYRGQPLLLLAAFDENANGYSLLDRKYILVARSLRSQLTFFAVAMQIKDVNL